MRRWLVRVGWFALAGLLGLCLWRPPELLLDGPRQTADRRLTRIVRRIASEQGVISLLTFDGPVVEDAISGRRGLAPGTVAAPARFGLGRKFDGNDETHIDLPYVWRSIGSAHTLAVWVKVDTRHRTQDILCSSGEGRQVGLRLVDGAMTFDIPCTEGAVALAYPFAGYDRFVHLAAVVDSAGHVARLYENGVLKTEREIGTAALPSYNVAIGKPMWYASRYPFRGVVDDLVVWSRALSPDEVVSMAHARHGALRQLADPVLYARWRASEASVRLLRGVVATGDLLTAWVEPLRGAGRVSPLPELSLTLSGPDRRHVVASHRRSLLSGRRTDKAAELRRAYAAQAGRVREAMLCLAGSDTAYGASARPGYVLELAAEAEPLFGTRRLRLLPPEDAGLLLPLVHTRLTSRFGVPVLTNGLCRLRLNGCDQGVYRFEDNACVGVSAGELPDVGVDRLAKHSASWGALLRPAAGPAWEAASRRRVWPLRTDELLACFDEVADDAGRALLADSQSPLLRVELERALATERARATSVWVGVGGDVPPAQAAADFLDEFMVLGSNPAPFRVVAPLAFDAPRFPGVTLRWRSSDPAVVDESGFVRRPDGDRPLGVTLTAILDDGTRQVEKPLAFRVMPVTIRVPAVMLHLADNVVKTRRVDAAVGLCDVGEDWPGRILPATQGRDGGVKHRGNSTYWYDKKAFSVKLDAPHRMLGTSESRTFLLTNPAADQTFVQNALSYGLFREFAGPGVPRHAPRVRPAEVYVNGRYHGLYELGERVDEAMLGLDGAGEGETVPPTIFFKHAVLRPRTPAMRVSRPTDGRGDLLEPYVALDRFMRETPKERWAADVERWIDVDSVIDLQLLLNLSQNENGVPFNFLAHDILVREGGADGRFFHVPWDFDRAYGPYWKWIANDMMRRLQSDFPGYRDRMAARWRELRAGALRTDRMAARIDELAAVVGPYVPWDRQRWSIGGGRSYESHIVSLHKAVRSNAETMDRIFDLAGSADSW